MADLYHTPKADASSIISLLNPFSSVAQTRDYVPKSVINLGRRLLTGDQNVYKDRVSHLVFKTGVSALTAAAIVAALRSAKHITQMQQISGNSMRKSLAGKVNTTTQQLIQSDIPIRKQSSQGSKATSEKASTSWFTAPVFDSTTQSLSTWLPALVAVLAASGTYKLVDKAQDKLLQKQLNRIIGNKHKQFGRYSIARAAQARDNTESPQYKQAVKQLQLSKKASGFGALELVPVNDALTILMAALAIGSGMATYSWAAKRNKKRLQYDAAKKALKQYSRVRATQQSLVYPTLSAQTIKNIQGDSRKKQAPVTDLPGALTGAPVSVEI